MDCDICVHDQMKYACGARVEAILLLELYIFHTHALFQMSTETISWESETAILA